MHDTHVKTKDGKEYVGTLYMFRPALNYFTLFSIDKKFSFDECESVITPNERLSIDEIRTCDEIKRAKEILDAGREFNWTEIDDDDNRKSYPKEKFEWEKKYEL